MGHRRFLAQETKEPAKVCIRGGRGARPEQVEGGYTLIVLSNYDPPSAEQIGRKVRGWLGFGDEVQALKTLAQHVSTGSGGS